MSVETVSGVPGWLCQQRVAVQVETGERVKGAGYHGNARHAAVPILHEPEQLHHAKAWWHKERLSPVVTISTSFQQVTTSRKTAKKLRGSIRTFVSKEI